MDNKKFNQLFVLLNTNVLIAAVSYVFTLFLINAFSVHEFGTYSYVLILGSFLSLVVSYATENTSVARFYAYGNIDKIISEVISVRIIMFLCSLIFIVFYMLNDFYGGVGLLAITLVAMNFGFVYEIKQKNKTYAYIYLIERLLYVAVSFIGVMFFEFKIFGVFFVLLIVTFLSLYFQLTSLGLRNIKFSLSGAFEGIKTNSFLFLSNIAIYSYGGFSRLILENKMSLTELAIYSVGWQIIMLITMYQTQIDRVWRMRLTRSLNEGYLSLEVKTFMVYSSLPIAAVGVVLSCFSFEIVTFLFSEKYIRLIEILPVLSIYFLVINLDSLMKMLLVNLEKTKYYFKIHTVFGFSLLIALYLLDVSSLFDFAVYVTCFHGAAVLIISLLVRFKFLNNIKI